MDRVLKIAILVIAVCFVGGVMYGHMGCGHDDNLDALSTDLGEGSDVQDGEADCPTCECNCGGEFEGGDVICECSADAYADCECPCEEDGEENGEEPPSCDLNQFCHVNEDGSTEELCLTWEEYCADYAFNNDLSQLDLCFAYLFEAHYQEDLDNIIALLGYSEGDYIGACDDDFMELCIEIYRKLSLNLDGTVIPLDDIHVEKIHEFISSNESVISIVEEDFFIPTLLFYCSWDPGSECKRNDLEGFYCTYCQGDCNEEICFVGCFDETCSAMVETSITILEECPEEEE
jgi:hypothetical protein